MGTKRVGVDLPVAQLKSLELFQKLHCHKIKNPDQCLPFSFIILTSEGKFCSGQKDSGIGQCPTGTPVLELGRT